MAQMNFSTQGIDTRNTYEALPPGEYTVVVSDSQMKQTASGTGHYLALTLQVQGPEQHRGRMLWDNLNISNPSAKAVEIAQRQLAQLVKACGYEGISDSEQLHNIPVVAIVKVDRSDTTRNVVKGYKSAGQPHLQAVPSTPQPQQTNAPEQNPAPPQPATQPQQPAMAAPPWLNQQ
jgi:hypothetical protein